MAYKRGIPKKEPHSPLPAYSSDEDAELLAAAYIYAQSNPNLTINQTAKVVMQLRRALITAARIEIAIDEGEA
jgi:hypothetical protein